MRPMESFVGQPVRSLQTMLRIIAQQDAMQPGIIPDGIYGQQTVAAVSAFQRRYGLPITGVTDLDTWEQIVAVYEPIRLRTEQPKALQIYFSPEQVIRRGQSDPNLYIVQGMLIVLSQAYGSIAVPGMTGVLDIPTSSSLSDFQQLSQLPVTGELDRITWHHLALHYPMAARQLQKSGEK